jgi:hypothetical protein
MAARRDLELNSLLSLNSPPEAYLLELLDLDAEGSSSSGTRAHAIGKGRKKSIKRRKTEPSRP